MIVYWLQEQCHNHAKGRGGHAQATLVCIKYRYNLIQI